MFFFIFTIFLSFYVICPHENVNVADYYTITRLTDAVYKRFYLIKRLEKAVALLHKNPPSLVLNKLEIDFFDNEYIKNAVLHAKSYHSLKPLSHIWKMFSSYQHVNDQSFTDDYVKLICFFYLTFFIQNRFIGCCLEDKLHWIDMALDSSIHNMQQLKKESFAQVTTDDIVKRYFILKRISKPMHMVTKLSNQEAYLLHKMPLMSYKSKKIFKLWDDIYQYKYVGNDEHMRYFLWYVFIMLYKHNKNVELLPLSFSQGTSLDFERMDIEELLTAIDSIVNNFNHINQHYQSSGLSLTAWVTKYWWIPALVMSSIIVNILKHYYLGSVSSHLWGLR